MHKNNDFRYHKLYLSIIAVLILISLFLLFESIKGLDNNSDGNYENELNKTLQELEIYKAKYSNINDEIKTVSSKIDSFKLDIEKSEDWFKENNNLKNFPALLEDIGPYLTQKCKQALGDTCELNLPCISDLNERKFDYIYHYDEEYGEYDKLFGISELVQHGGGDCEDISLLYVAQINYLKEECFKNEKIKKIKIKTFSFEEGEDTFLIRMTGTMKYYFSNIVNKNFVADNFHAYPVCGNFKNDSSGHCVVAFSKQEIKESKDVYPLLKDSFLVEPQTSGDYLFHLNDTSEISILDDNVLPVENIIFYVILKNDLAYFNNYKSEKYYWRTYSDFKVELEDDLLALNKEMN